ncbi:MAG TPA: NAD(P)-binding domain-containing protein [Thermoanaerobaculia bacterium]|nr:NAD(P)-binding domain-containing protein [Thermoanaerobaculia bacterium]
MKIAIIGAGPIGLELAVALKQAHIDYVQIDAEQIGATMSWYPLQMVFHSSADRIAIAGVPIQIPDQQKPKREEYLAYLRAIVQQFALEVRTYERVTSARRLDDGTFELRTRAVDGEHTYVVDAVVLAIGAMHAPRLLGIPGEELPHVSHYFHEPHAYFGKRLLIIGGRNSAVEAAIRCQRAGAHVTISYRGEEIDPSVKFWLLPEIRGMIRDGRVRFLPRTSPVEIGGGSVLLDSGERVDADFVLLLTGYRQDPTLFEQLGVDLQGDARKPRYDETTMETNVRNVFVAGTAISGSPEERVRVIVEDCHEHVPKIVEAISERNADF